MRLQTAGIPWSPKWVEDLFMPGSTASGSDSSSKLGGRSPHGHIDTPASFLQNVSTLFWTVRDIKRWHFRLQHIFTLGPPPDPTSEPQWGVQQNLRTSPTFIFSGSFEATEDVCYDSVMTCTIVTHIWLHTRFPFTNSGLSELISTFSKCWVHLCRSWVDVSYFTDKIELEIVYSGNIRNCNKNIWSVKKNRGEKSIK